MGVTLGVDPRHLLIYTHSMEILVDLPAPSCKGTYIALVEPNVVKIGTSNCISKRLTGIRTSTFRRVALLAWTNTPEYNVHELFDADRITISREFFRVSDNLITFVNDCRVILGFQEIEEVLLWEFGGPLPYGLIVEGGLTLSPEWVAKIRSLSLTLQVSVTQLLKTIRFRSESRSYLRDRVVEWLSKSGPELNAFLTREELNLLRGVAPSKISEPVSPEDRVRRGKYYTHLRWHKNKPKPSCEFCTQSAVPQ